MKGNGIIEHRRFVRARVSLVSSNCPICILKNTSGIDIVKRISELHHIFGRETRNPKHIKESIFGTMALCNPHHQEYPPLLSVEEYLRNKEHWDILFNAYWRCVGLFNFLSNDEKEVRNKLFQFTMEEFIEYFTGG